MASSHEQQHMIYVIANPMAGSISMEKLKDCLNETAARCCVSYELYETKAKDNFQNIVDEAIAKGVSRFVVVGGDGTVSAVASALIDKDRALAIIPAGTANLLAKSLQIPLEMEKACHLAITSSNTIDIDALETNERNFFSHISVGAYSWIAEKTPANAKKLLGRLAYIWSGIIVFFKGRAWQFQLEIDDKHFEVKASTIMIANVGELGARQLKWGAHIYPNDGIVDICVINAKTASDYLVLLKDFLLGQPRKSSMTRYFKAQRHIKVSGPAHLPIRGDGEIITNGTVEAKIFPKALKVVY